MLQPKTLDVSKSAKTQPFVERTSAPRFNSIGRQDIGEVLVVLVCKLGIQPFPEYDSHNKHRSMAGVSAPLSNQTQRLLLWPRTT